MKKLILLSTLILFLASCGKDGCPDPNSINYNPKAKEYSETCEYEMTIVFWFDFDTWNLLEDDDVSILKYYIDNILVYEESQDIINDAWTNENQACSLSENKHVFIEKYTDSKGYTIEVKAYNSQGNYLYNWSSYEIVYANLCTTYRLDI